jgi:hypothetical protein
MCVRWLKTVEMRGAMRMWTSALQHAAHTRTRGTLAYTDERFEGTETLFEKNLKRSLWLLFILTPKTPMQKILRLLKKRRP